MDYIKHLSKRINHYYRKSIEVLKYNNKFPRVTIIREWIQRNKYLIKVSALYT